MNAYIQYPALFQDRIVFVCQDSLWTVPREGGTAYRLTERLSGCAFPVFSRDGGTLFFSAQGEVMSVLVSGGAYKTLTCIHAPYLSVVGHDRREQLIISSPHAHPFGVGSLYTLAPEGGIPTAMECCGTGEFLSYGPTKGRVLQRQGYGYASWKRYQGGKVGVLWIDREENGSFEMLLAKKHNMLRPFWIGERIYFLSDFEGIGNIYSCALTGEDVEQHTRHEDCYARQSSVYGHEIVYSCEGRVFLFDTQSGKSTEISVEVPTGDLSVVRVFRDPARYVGDYDVSSKGPKLALTTRGRLFDMTPWKGPVQQRGERDGVRYRLARWLHCGKRIAVLRDEGSEEFIETHEEDVLVAPTRYKQEDFGVDWGRVLDIMPSPCKNELLLTDHRNELLWLNLETKEGRTLDHSPRGQFLGIDWSPDGRWIVYAVSSKTKASSIKLYDVQEKNTYTLTEPLFHDFSPSFDPEGKFIYFLSFRTFSPQWQCFSFNLSFAPGTKIYAIALQADGVLPFVKVLLSEDEGAKEEDKKEDASEGQKNGDKKDDEKKEEAKKDKKPDPIKIDLVGIQERITAFPVKPGDYGCVIGLKGSLLYFEDTDDDNDETGTSGIGNLLSYDFASLKEETLVEDISSFTLSLDRSLMAYGTQRGRIRVVAAGAKPDESDTSFRGGGWLDWSRVTLSVCPQKEWRHMFDEAWRLQKEMFWTPTMGDVDWDAVYQRHRPAIDRISSYSELLAVMADMHGELGTSHAYIFPRKEPSPPKSFFGAQFVYEPKRNVYVIAHLCVGNAWEPEETSAFRRTDLGLKEGHLVWAVGGQRVSSELTPDVLLLRQGARAVPVVVSDSDGNNKRTVVVFTVSSEHTMRYRDWVDRNAAFVHQKGEGKIGYVHIPDMSRAGFGTFMRGYLQEFDREGLIIDARFNGGGNVSPLIIDYLTRKRLGHDQSRWQGIFPHPDESPRGPMVALVNAYTGSDGDIFAHCFRELKLGPLIGKRTWGGVVGIWPRHSLLDGTMTTQPEYSFWFNSVGWSIENYGVDPDIEIDIFPQDEVAGRDPQLERAIAEVFGLISR